MSEWADGPARKLPKKTNLAGATLVIEVRETDSLKPPVVTEFPVGSTKPLELPGG